MKDNELKYSVISMIVASLATFTICFTLMIDHTKPIEPPKCTHLTEMQAVSKYLSYCIYVDSIQYAKKKDRVRLADSILKYKIK